MIQSVDSLKLSESYRQGSRSGRIEQLIVFFKYILPAEESKFGFSITEVEEMLVDREFGLLKNVTICGVMGMATFTDNSDIVRGEFRQLRKISNIFAKKVLYSNNRFTEISMGMSDDFKIAIEEGSTILRIGSMIFGER